MMRIRLCSLEGDAEDEMTESVGRIGAPRVTVSHSTQQAETVPYKPLFQCSRE